MRFTTLILLILSLCAASSDTVGQAPIIFDTDMGPDYDDVGAITMLHHYADAGKIRILATVASDGHPRVAATLSVLNTYFKRPDLPIGVPAAGCVMDGDVQHWTDTLVARYPHRLKQNADAPDAVKLYRQLLAAQQDHSVTVITVGFLTNLARLLQSPPDQHSRLTGSELVARKVKALYCMAGWFPEGREYNILRDAAAAQLVFDRWPTSITLSGFEVGEKIKTGLPLVNNTGIKGSPVKDVFRICLAYTEQDHLGRMSWDQTAVLAACGDGDQYFSTTPGRITVDAQGHNTWDPNGAGHSRLVLKQSAAAVTAVINNLMMHQPNE